MSLWVHNYNKVVGVLGMLIVKGSSAWGQVGDIKKSQKYVFKIFQVELAGFFLKSHNCLLCGRGETPREIRQFYLDFLLPL